MENTAPTNFKPIESAEQLIDIWNKLPEEKRDILKATINGLIAGMEIQERLEEKKAI